MTAAIAGRDFLVAVVGLELAEGRAGLREGRPPRPPDLVLFSLDAGGGLHRAAALASSYGCPAVVWGGGFPKFAAGHGNVVMPATEEPVEFAKVSLDEPDGVPYTSLFVSTSATQPAVRGFGVFLGNGPPGWRPSAWFRPPAVPSPFPRFYVCSP